jgi:hypothetical protein
VAVRKNDGTSSLTRYSGGNPTTNSFSLCFWLYVVSAPGGGGWSIFVANGTGGTGSYVGTADLVFHVGDWAVDTWGSTLSTGRWYHVGWVRTAGTITNKVYLDGALDIDDSAVVADYGSDWTLHNPNWTNDGGNQKLAHLKIWDNVQLTQTEIQQEMRVAPPVRRSNLWGWYPFTESMTRDYSGNGKDWTTSGATLSIEDGPPVSWGAAPLANAASRAIAQQSLLWLPPEGGV